MLQVSNNAKTKKNWSLGSHDKLEKSGFGKSRAKAINKVKVAMAKYKGSHIFSYSVD